MNYFVVFADASIIHFGTESLKACEVFNTTSSKKKQLEIIQSLDELNTKFKLFLDSAEDVKILNEEEPFDLKKEWNVLVEGIVDHISTYTGLNKKK